MWKSSIEQIQGWSEIWALQLNVVITWREVFFFQIEANKHYC